MPTFTLQAQQFVPYSFIVTAPNVLVEVEAEHPIDIYILGADQINAFKNDPMKFSGAKQQSQYSQQFTLPWQIGSTWWLVMANPNPKPTAVHYEVANVAVGNLGTIRKGFFGST